MATHPNVIDVTEATFEKDVLQKSYRSPVVVDFWAPWCGPCRMLGPILERLAAEPGSNFILAKLNTDENPDISGRYQIRGIPAVKGFRNGQVVAEFVGAQPEPQVRQFLRQLVPASGAAGPQQTLEQAQALLRERNWKAAEAAFRALLAQQAENSAARLGLARTLLYRGDGCAAESQLKDFPPRREYGSAERLRPLARYLCQMSDGRPNGQQSDLEQSYRQAAALLRQREIAGALYHLLSVLRQDKAFRGGEAKQVMIGVFELLGDEDPLTQEYRRHLASVIY